MIRFIIVADVGTVLVVIKKSRFQIPNGKLLDIRKNPHAIDVGSRLDIAFNY
jgi:hypothetical protein